MKIVSIVALSGLVIFPKNVFSFIHCSFRVGWVVFYELFHLLIGCSFKIVPFANI